MAAVWRVFTSTAKMNFFSAFPSTINHINAFSTAKRGLMNLNYIYSSILRHKKSHNLQNQKSFGFVTSRSLSTSSSLNKYYVKPNYLKKCGRRDHKRREMFKEYEVERAGLRMIRKSDILPSGVRQKAAEDLRKLPLNSSLTRVRNRCVLTDRGRGIVGRFRVSRMMFRYFAEKGLIAGVQKAQW